MNSSRYYVAWNHQLSALTLGKSLILLEEVQLLKELNSLSSITLLFTNPNGGKPPPYIAYSDAITEIQTFSDEENFRSFLENHQNSVIQELGTATDNMETARGESMRFLQKRFLEHGFIPNLAPSSALLEATHKKIKILSQEKARKKTIAVHLKQNPVNSLSNANFKEWGQLFQYAEKERPEWLFILVGNESPGDLGELANTYWTGGKNILEDLALSWGCDAFMGMSSGICQAALFGRKPYTVFKHPEHHAEEMSQELMNNNTFTFIQSHQRFLRAYDEFPLLQEEFLRIAQELAI